MSFVRILLLLVVLLYPVLVLGQDKLQWKDFGFLDAPPDKLQIEAEELKAKGENGPVLLRGDVRIYGDNLDIRSEWVEILPSQDKVILGGSVRVVEGQTVLLADRVELDRKSSQALLDNAIILVKKDTSRQELRQCMVAYRLVKEGFNALNLQGQRILRRDDTYFIRQARFTACDCGDEAPSWEIRAYKADVEPNQGAWMYWPILYVKGFPVFILPFAYVPLSERRSGFLFPMFNYSGRDGFIFSESFYLTLGESADTTLSLDWFEERGWRERLEFRLRPAPGARLDTRIMYMDDRKLFGDENTRKLHHRYSIETQAWMQTQSGMSVNLNAMLFSDSDIKSDFASEMAGRAVDYTNSSLAVIKPGSDQLLAFELTYVQDLRYRTVDLFDTIPNDPVRSGVEDTVHRLGVLSYALAPIEPFKWPISFSLWFEASNFSSLSAAWRDWGMDSIPDVQEPRYSEPVQNDDRSSDNQAGGEADGILGDGELRRALRFAVEPSFNFDWKISSLLQMNLGIKHRQLVYIPHGPDASAVAARGHTFLRLDLRSRLTRVYGSGENRIGHSISPWMSLVGVWQGLRTEDPFHMFDWQDRMVSDAQQILLGSDTGLYRFGGNSGWMEFLKLRLFQGFDPQAGKFTQAGLELDARFPLISGRAVVGVDWDSSLLAESNLGLQIRDKRGDRLRLSYVYLPSVRDSKGRPMPLSERVQRETDLLFGQDPAYYRALGETIHVAEANANINLAWGLGLSAGASLNIREMNLAYYQGGISYKSDCRCFGFMLTVRMMHGQDIPDIFFTMDLSYLGSMGLKTHDMY